MPPGQLFPIKIPCAASIYTPNAAERVFFGDLLRSAWVFQGRLNHVGARKRTPPPRGEAKVAKVSRIDPRKICAVLPHA